MTKLFIGMPVYNGERFISLAIESLRNQTFTDWKLLISDNGSTDGTQGICEKYCLLDKRITYFRQKQNLGAPANFKFVLDWAETPFFMWAACDDVWHPEFIATCLGHLEKNSIYGLAFCNIVSIDTYGRTIRTLPDFQRFASDNHLKNVIAYVSDPEIMGKANIIYAIYRTDVCKNAWEKYPLIDRWGSDISFILAALAHTRLIIDDRVLFYKRNALANDNIDETHVITIANPNNYVFPVQVSLPYLFDHLRATRGTKFLLITLIIMTYRICCEVVKFLYKGFKKILNKLGRPLHEH